MSIPTFREVQDDITAQLRDQGFLAAILVDLGPLAHIERAFGGAAFRSLRAQVDPLLLDMRERFRQDDFITRDEREGDRFLAAFPCPENLRPDFESMTAELVDYRLAHYAKTRLQAAAELSAGRFLARPPQFLNDGVSLNQRAL